MRFIDTSYLLALELANDQNYSGAQAHGLLSAPPRQNLFLDGLRLFHCDRLACARRDSYLNYLTILHILKHLL